MSDDNRKPVFIAIACACVAVLVLVVGVGLGIGGGSNTAGPSWRETLAGIAAGAPLTPRDLLVTSGSCTVTGKVITVSGTCTFSVGEFGGAFGLGPPTKKASVIAGGRIQVTTEIEGATVSRDVTGGERVDVVIGRGGGSLHFACLSLPPCQLTLA